MDNKIREVEPVKRWQAEISIFNDWSDLQREDERFLSSFLDPENIMDLTFSSRVGRLVVYRQLLGGSPAYSRSMVFL